MGILDFLSKKSPAAPAPAGATETTAAPAKALKAEIVNHGLDASKINIAVDGSTVTLTGGAATTADVEKIALAVGNTKGVTKVINNIAADAPHQDRASTPSNPATRFGRSPNRTTAPARGRDPNRFSRPTNRC